MSLILARSHNSGEGGFTPAQQQSVILDGASYLTRTFASGDNLTWLYSKWVYRSKLGDQQSFFSTISGNESRHNFLDNDTLQVYCAGGGAGNLITSQVFRDVGWYNIGVLYDSTDVTDTERFRLLINGQRVTSFTTETYPTLNESSGVNNAVAHYIGRDYLGVNHVYNGGFSQDIFLDGQKMTDQEYRDTFLREFPFNGGVIVAPKNVGSLTYGTNGHNIDFADSADFGNDVSGNNNDWTPTGFISTDQITDVPGDPYCIISPISGGSGGTVGEGGTTFVGSASGSFNSSRASLPASDSGCYFEFMFSGSSDAFVGFYDPTVTIPQSASATSIIGRDGSRDDEFSYRLNSGVTFRDGVTGTTYTALTPATQWGAMAYKNGSIYIGTITAGTITWFNSGDPVAETGAVYTGFTGDKFFGVSSSSLSTLTLNFGQKPFDASSLPTGYTTIKASNLPTPEFNGQESMNAILWSGNNATNRVFTGVGFQPGFLWAKVRNQSQSHIWNDSVRGAPELLSSNNTNVEQTFNNLSSFDVDGFTGGSQTSSFNESGDTYVGWNWKAGGIAVPNTNGTITSQVSVAPEGHFSVLTYEGDATSGATVGTGLDGVEMFINKSLDSATYAWNSWHVGLTDEYYIPLSSTSAQDNSVNIYPSAGRTGDLVQLATSATKFNNLSGNTYVSYCFKSVPGLCKLGSYTGNGNADGPYIYCGFKPRWILIRRFDSADDWMIFDTARDTFNGSVDEFLRANLSNTASSANKYVDLYSGGFKARSLFAPTNANGASYLYVAFAEEAGGGILPFPLGR